MSAAAGRHHGRVTAAMVAQRAGVSAAAVSLFVNNRWQGRLTEPVRQRIETAVNELQYVVNGAASSLASGISRTVVMGSPALTNPYFAALATALSSALDDEYELMILASQTDNPVSPREIHSLIDSRTAGLIYHGVLPAAIARLRLPFPVIQLDTAGATSDLDSIDLDVEHAGRLLGHHFGALGHRCAAYFGTLFDAPTFAVREAAFVDAFAQHGGVVEQPAGFASAADTAQAFDVAVHSLPELLAQGVTAIACATDAQALGVAAAAQRLGIRVPGELAYAGFDNVPLAAYANPPITSIDLGIERLGTAAGQLLMRRLRDRQAPPVHETLPIELLVRASTAH